MDHCFYSTFYWCNNDVHIENKNYILNYIFIQINYRFYIILIYILASWYCVSTCSFYLSGFTVWLSGQWFRVHLLLTTWLLSNCRDRYLSQLLLVFVLEFSWFSLVKSEKNLDRSMGSSVSPSLNVSAIMFSFSLRSFSICICICSFDSCLTFWYVFRMRTACRKQHSASGIFFNFLMLCLSSCVRFSLSRLFMTVFWILYRFEKTHTFSHAQ